MLHIFFPILKVLEELEWNDCDRIVANNLELAKELEGMPPMTAQEIKQYVNKQNKQGAGGACEIA
jgi:hypothetical protein